jgi:hypothetical protein
VRGPIVRRLGMDKAMAALSEVPPARPESRRRARRDGDMTIPPVDCDAARCAAPCAPSSRAAERDCLSTMASAAGPARHASGCTWRTRSRTPSSTQPQIGSRRPLWLPARPDRAAAAPSDYRSQPFVITGSRSVVLVFDPALERSVRCPDRGVHPDRTGPILSHDRIGTKQAVDDPVPPGALAPPNGACHPLAG